MKKKNNTKKKTSKPGIKGIPNDHGNKTFRDLKREAIIRGMPFPDTLSSGIGDLINFIDYSNNKPDVTLIDQYDDWMVKQLDLIGVKQSPSLRLGFIGEQDEEGKTLKKKRVKGLEKPKKKKRERDDNGLYKGTKKAYTFELAKRGFTLERIVRRVLKKFPDASEKSIKIWQRQATTPRK